MDITKVPDEEKLRLCKWYFRVGFLCLPFLWAINFVWFFGIAFTGQNELNERHKSIRKYVILSGIGAAIWAVVLGTWIAVFQINRADWGEFADSISFIIPLGKL